ncbi:hypothetical protein QFC22_001059 [Naganishia vaughanmartiniae]|uniref:Uncharacterized protein n=1 Tax=Naganishia vaughanmartiniae TaxID=1424756 RepID=A0ACC2XLK3_9TREE|nr:hypothetical protein QFC22_001059 [Naganishia vaughanmartiniae]
MEGDERKAAEMIESKMETMRMTIEDLEDSVVLMRQAIAPLPSSKVHIFGSSPSITPREEAELHGKLKSKKDKKPKRSKLGKRHASSPSLWAAELPSDPALQPLPSSVKSKTSIGRSSASHSKCRPSGHKHSREESASTIVPSSIGQDHSPGQNTAPEGSSKSGMRRSHSHSGAKLFEQLFQKRSLHRSGHRNTISVANPSYPLDIHSAPVSPLSPSLRSFSPLNSTALPVLDPLVILRDMETAISNLRHQHSSILTLLPLSNHTSSRTLTTWTTSGTSTISDSSSGRDYFGTPTQGISRRQSRDPDTTVIQASSMISPKAQAAHLRGLSSDLDSGEPLSARERLHDQQSEHAHVPHHHHHHHHRQHHSRPHGIEESQNITGRDHHHRRKVNHNHRSSLSSLYAEVASIYYDAEVGADSEEVHHRSPKQSTTAANRSSSEEEKEIERALEREVSRHDSDDQTAVDSNLSKVSDDESGASTPKLSGTEPGKLKSPVPAGHPHYSGPIIRRSALPAPAPKTEPSLIGMLKKNVGKIRWLQDMSTIAFDVSFNEPISLLQKLAEEVEYFDLLELANLAIDATERLAHVAAFAISQYASAKYRSVRKPFNPLQGETYELYREDLGLRFISEKVNHHPPKFAAKADGKGWQYACTSAGKNRLAGMSLEIQPLGAQHVTLIDQGERYTWTKPLSYMRNLIAGTKYLETIGEMVMTNETNGEKCVVTFKEGGWSGATRNHVAGICYKSDGKTKAAWIDGIWDSHLEIRYGGPKDPAHPLWIVHPWPTKPELNYGFTKWAIGLNELTPDLVGVIAPSDSRLRPDQRLLEEGRFTEADQLKLKLEETQRKRKAEGHEVQPRWFKASNATQDEWTYNGGYWEAREEGTLNTKAVDFLFDPQQ